MRSILLAAPHALLLPLQTQRLPEMEYRGSAEVWAGGKKVRRAFFLLSFRLHLSYSNSHVSQ
jgi:hypothetical protein